MKHIRKTAFLLAFVLFVGCVPNIALTDVFASATSLLFRSEYVLSIGTNNDNPTLSNLGQPQNAWMFEWDTKILEEDESAKLQYQLEKDKRLVVTTTKKAEGNTQVDIKLVKDDGTEITYEDKDFMIYTSQDLNFVQSTNFFDGTGNPNMAYNGEDDKRVLYTGATKNQVSFMLNSASRPVGYSIKYKNYNFHFLLNQNGAFDFYQEGGFESGRVYNAEFTNTPVSGAATTVIRKFSIGLNLEKIVTAPFVDTDSDTKPNQYAEDKYSIEANNNVSLNDADQVGFEYTIQLPFEYDTVTKNFTTKPVAEKSQVVLTFGIPSDSNYFAMTVEIPASPTDTDVATITSAPTFKEGGSAEVLELVGNKLTVRFSGLKEGLLLTPTVAYTIIDSNTSTPSLVKQLNQTTTKAYTFPKYTIVNKDGADYVSIEPFLDYAGHYVLYSATSSNPNPVNVTSLKYASSFFKENAKSTDNVLLPLAPVPESGSKVYDYKIFFNPDVRFENPNSLLDNGVSDLIKLIRSRYFYYEAKDRGTIGFPNNFEITNDNQSKMFNPKMPQYDTDGAGNYVEDFQDLSYTLAWDIGKITSIDKLISTATDSQVDITYVVELGDTVESNERKDFMKFTFTLDGSGGANKAKIVGDPVVEFIGATGGTGVPKKILNNIKDARIVTSYSTQSNGYTYRLEVDVEDVILDTTVEDKYLSLKSDIFFEYPNIYFMVVRPEEYTLTTTDTDGKEVDVTSYFDKSNSSVIRSLTLNKDLSVKLRTPVEIETQNMVTQFAGDTTPSGSIATKDQVSFEVWYKMQAEAMHNYMNYYFTNFDLTHYGQNMQFTNDIYISQNYDLMTKTIANLEKPDRIKNSTELDLSDYDFETNINEEGVPVVMLREFAKNTTDAPVVKTTTGVDGIDILRDEKVLRISNIPMSETTIDENGNYVLPTSDILDKLEINGLDTNAKYYVYVDLNVEYLAEDGERRYLDNKSTKPLKESSKISALASGTTGSEIQEPSILDEVPVMPDVNLVSVGRNNYSVTWDKVNMDISDPTRYSQEFQYEVLRIRDTKLKDEYLDTRKDLNHVFKHEIDTQITDKSAQRLSENTSTGQPTVMAYNPTTNSFVTPPANLYKQVYNNNSIIYDDNSLTSNKVYFVYVRTVRVITDKTTGDVYNTYSAWDVLSATTVLGESPIDLQVLYKYPTTSYDPKTQIPLSFRAKVPNLDDIGKEITFQVTYKTSGQEWVVPITIDSATLKKSASAIDAEGYRTFTFFLTGLKPGTSYSIEVRQANADGSFTPYSNIVQWKTEIDEDEYDKDDDNDAFDDLIDDLIDELIDGSQVELENDSKDRVVMINGNNLTNEIASSKANTLMISGLEKGKNNTFLIPFEAYENANKKGLAWQFAYKDMFFNLSPKTINSDYNESVLKLSKKVDRNYIEDYYMELSFDYKGNYKKLQNDDALTDVVSINMELRATTENVLDFQQEELVATLDEVRNSDLALAKRQKVLDQIAAGMDSQDALELVYDYVDYIEETFQDKFNDKLTAIRQKRDDETVTKLDKTLIMGTTYQNVLSKVTAYSITTRGVATPLPTTRSKDVSTAVVKNFGSYGFGGNVVNIAGSVDTSGNNNISNIVAENDLEDTLSNTGGVVNTSSDITVSQALQAMSNMTGMSIDETKTVLSKNGVNINRNNQDKSLTEDLGVAMIGVLYEQLNNINPDKVTINDYKFYNSLKSSGISESYIPHIQLCKEVGIITAVPSKTKAVTVGNFLSMLDKC